MKKMMFLSLLLSVIAVGSVSASDLSHNPASVGFVVKRGGGMVVVSGYVPGLVPMDICCHPRDGHRHHDKHHHRRPHRHDDDRRYRPGHGHNDRRDHNRGGRPGGHPDGRKDGRHDREPDRGRR